MTTYVPIVDISQHQGVIDFRKMRAGGVKGIIFRAVHGRSVDTKLHTYILGARAAGYEDSDFGFYSFINPKRGGGLEMGVAFVSTVRQHLGHIDTFFMLDVESYENEPGAGPVIHGPPFAAWLRDFVKALVGIGIPRSRIVIYSNAAYWDPNVGDVTFGEFDIIVARYPFYTSTSPQPPATAARWADWILTATASRPRVPRGWDGWDGWQFSAGFNRMGPVFGCESSDLDLNIVDADAWARWTAVKPAPPVEHPAPIVVAPPVVVAPAPAPYLPLEDEMVIITNSEGHHGNAPLSLKWALVHAAHEDPPRFRLVNITPAEHAAAGSPVGQPLTSAEIDALGFWTAPTAQVPVVTGSFRWTGSGTVERTGADL